ncbi:glycoside hydrolase family 43 protein [Niabella insulamsoli]|uniref:glycoside hydrolase family 43 protein n=1 Tax=Niabella insulamsoli TaxID=3144874 RepID=UPI0031FD23A1
MQKIFLISLACLAISSLSCQNPSSKKEVDFKNPLNVQFGDPYVLRASNGMYYMYGTGAGAKKGFAAYSSADLIDWKKEGQVYFGNNPNGWGLHSYWAPEVYERDGKYYMFYSAQWKVNPTNEEENFKIGVAVSDEPTGPFTDIKNEPLFDPGYPIIDANVLFADNGKTYLYYSRCCYKHPVESEVATWAKQKGWFDEIEESWVYGIEMKADLSGVIGEPVLLLRPPVKMDDKQAEWESRSVTSKEVNRRWTEGSYIFKNNDTYYMMYSANYFGGQNYAVGYATSKSPLGPFTKAANNPVLQKNTASGGIVTGTGHNSVTLSPDGKTMLCVYHGRTSATGDERVVFIDKMRVSDNGMLVVEGPTTEPREQP